MLTSKPLKCSVPLSPRSPLKVLCPSVSRGACDADEPSDLGDFQTQLTMEKKMGEHTFASVVVTHLLSKGKRRLQDRKMFGRPQPRWDSRLVEPLIERFAIPDHQYYLLDCALGFQSRKSNSDRFQTEDEIVLIPFGASKRAQSPHRALPVSSGWVILTTLQRNLRSVLELLIGSKSLSLIRPL